MYNPREIYSFLISPDLRSVIGKSFYKRHMESDETESPFDTPEEIFMLEYLIANGYIIAEYRSDHANDSESYLISTMWHAFVKNYKQSPAFRIRSWIYYSSVLYWIIFASTLGSLLASFIWNYLHT